ncbi:MAG: glycosyltransferase family 2 protein [Zoogloeaceae bacterium]|nr:glycosyltransferase family 2 protein [Zoogloeaceae bacterium]
MPDSDADGGAKPNMHIEVSAVMPCLNEERTLGACIQKAQQAFVTMGVLGEVVVADNGSTDGSVGVAKSFGANVVYQPVKGYGAALVAGIEAARGRVVVIADADDSYDWEALPDFVNKIDEGFDLVMGNRFKGGIAPGAMPPLHRYLGNPVLSTLARVMYRIPIGDFHCGMRSFTREAFARMQPRTTGMEFATEMVVNAGHSGLRIAEIPTRLFPDGRDRPPHLRSFRDGWRHLRFMLTYAPDWLFLVPGLLFAALGLLGVLALARGPIALNGFSMGIHFLALFSMISLLGSNIAGFWLLSKLINAPRVPLEENSLSGRLLRYFSLERGLIAGVTMVLVGFAINVTIFYQWIDRARGDMTDTVHLAFSVATVIVLGVNLMFGSFLLHNLKDRG